MRHKFGLGFLSLIISIISLAFSFNPTLTGNVIGTNVNTSYFYFISLVFFILSILIFTSRKTLDAIIIPGGQEKQERTERAVKEYLGGGANILLISGRIDKPIKTSEIYSTYKRLRSYGIKPGEMVVEGKSANTLENVLFSLEKLKKRGAHDVGIASNPTHLDRFEYVIKKAKEEGIVDKDFRVHRLETSETAGQWIYGVVSNWLYEYELRHGLKNAEKPWFHKPIKKVIDYFSRKAREKPKEK